MKYLLMLAVLLFSAPAFAQGKAADSPLAPVGSTQMAVGTSGASIADNILSGSFAYLASSSTHFDQRGNLRIGRFVCTVTCFISVQPTGNNMTATVATGIYLPADLPLLLRIPTFANVSAITSSGSGTLIITGMSPLRKLAIIGLSPQSHDLAPWRDGSWEKWGCAWDVGYGPFLDIAFDPHDLTLLRQIPQNGLPRDYFERLRDFDHVFLQEKCEEVPNATPYPLWEVIDVVGDYFGSTPAYMLALAIYQHTLGNKIGHLGVWGVDMDDPQHKAQRPNFEYLVGFARGSGIPVEIHESSPLCKFEDDGIPLGQLTPGYFPRYGYITHG